MASPLPTFFKAAFKLGLSVNGNDYNTFTLPLVEDGTYNFTVNWGDGTSNHITTWDDSNKSHVYSSLSGNNMVTMIVSLTGICTKLSFYIQGDSTSERLVELIDVADLGFTFLDFFNCINLTTISPTLNRLTHLTTALRMFNGCEKLEAIPAGIFDGSVGIHWFQSAFTGCALITSIPEHLFDNNINADNFGYTFSGTGILSIPTNLFQYNTAVTTYYQTFSQCSSLTGLAPALWSLDPLPEGLSCFAYSTGLTNYSSIPEYWRRGV